MNNDIKRNMLVAAMLSGCLGLAVSAHAASFDCAKAGTRIEHLICDNPEISRLDDELNTAYKAALKDQAQAEAIKQAQRRWVKGRSGCVDAACVKNSYAARLKSLNTSKPNPATNKPVTCSPEINVSGEWCNYRYELELNKNDKVCKHMKEVFDFSFARPFDLNGISEKQQRDELFPIYSHYPSSKEFDAVVWRNPTLIEVSHDGKQFPLPAPMAEFDIDNDGENEIVIKRPWFNGERDSTETILIFKKDEIDPKQITKWSELVGRPGKRPRVIGNGERIIRPFIFDGMSYLAMYEATGRGAFWGRQTMWVRQYKGGGRVIPPEETPLQIEDVCKFNMVRFD